MATIKNTRELALAGSEIRVTSGGVDLASSLYYFTKDELGSFSPASITITATASSSFLNQGTAPSYVWHYCLDTDISDEGNWTLLSGETNSTLNITNTSFNTQRSASTIVRYRCTVSKSGMDSASSILTIGLVDNSAAASAVTTRLSQQVALISAGSDGTGYSLSTATGTYHILVGATPATGQTYSIVGGTDNGTTWSKSQNGLTLTINETTGVYTTSGGSWTSDSETFTIRVTYNGNNYDSVYTVTKVKQGTSGDGIQGDSARRAYTVVTVGTLGSGEVVVVAPNTLPPTNSVFGSGLTWSHTPPASLSAGEYLFQSDGIYNPGTTNTTYTTPYLSSLKVGTLEAITTVTGNLDATGNITVGTTGKIFSTGKISASNTTPGFFLGYDSGAYKLTIGDANGSLTWDGTTLSYPTSKLSGTITNSQISTGLDASKLTVGTIPIDRIASAAIDSTKFANSIKPIEIVSTLPGTPHVTGRTVFLTTDNKLYRNTGTGWIATISGGDVTSGINAANITTGTLPAARIGDGSVAAAKFVSSIKPVEIVDGLPGAPHTAGRVAYNVQDGKLYRNTGSGWTAEVLAEDVAGQFDSSQVNIDIGGTNLLYNSLFTVIQDGTTRPAGWHTSSIGTGITTNITTISDGDIDKAISFEITGITPPTQYATHEILLPVDSGILPQTIPGNKYTFSVWAKTTTLTYYINGRVSWFGAGFVPLDITNAFFTGTILDSINTWQKLSGTLTAPPGAIYARIRIGLTRPSTSDTTLGTVFFKKPQLEGGSYATEFSPRPSELLPGVITATEISDNAVTSDKIIAGAVIAGKISTDAVSANNIQAQAVTSAKIYSGAVEADRIQANNLAANSIIAGKIAAGAVTTTTMTANSIDGDRIAAGTLDADRITANSITAGQIAAGAIAAAEIAAGAITASKLTLVDTSNVYPDFDMLDPDFYTGNGSYGFSSTSYTSSGQKRIRINSNAAEVVASTKWFQCEPNTEYYVEALVFMEDGTPSGSGDFLLNHGSLSNTGVVTWVANTVVANNISSTTATKYNTTFVTGSTVRRLQAVFRRDPGGDSAFTVGGIVIRRRANSNLIVDGAITAEKINVNNLQAVSATTGNLTIDSAGSIKGGATSYSATTGFWLGYDVDKYKLRIGNPSGARLQWDGVSLNIYNASNQLAISAGTPQWQYVGGSGKPADNAQVNAPGLGASRNKLAFSTAGNGEIYLHGFGTNGLAADVDGYIIYNGTKYTVSKGYINPNMSGPGYILFDTAGRNLWSNAGQHPNVIYAKKFNTSWVIYGDSGATYDVPQTVDASIVVIGEAYLSNSELVDHVSIYTEALPPTTVPESNATVGAQSGVNLLDSAGSTVNDITFLNKYSNGDQLASDLTGNPFMTKVDPAYDRPAGWKMTYDASNPTYISYADSPTRSIMRIFSNGVDSAIGAGAPAFRVQPNMRYRAFIRWRAVDANTGNSGLYFRFLYTTDELPQGKTHLAVSGTAESAAAIATSSGSNTCSIISDTNGQSGVYENKSVTALNTWYETVVEYTPTSTTKWAAFTILNWSGLGSSAKIDVDSCFIYPITTAADGATVGATFGVNIGGQITSGNASTYIADAAIGSAQVGTLVASNINANGLSIKNESGAPLLVATGNATPPWVVAVEGNDEGVSLVESVNTSNNTAVIKNIAAGDGVSLSDNGAGLVTINSTANMSSVWLSQNRSFTNLMGSGSNQVDGLFLPVEANSVYIAEAYLRVRTPATTTGISIGCETPYHATSGGAITTLRAEAQTTVSVGEVRSVHTNVGGGCAVTFPTHFASFNTNPAAFSATAYTMLKLNILIRTGSLSGKLQIIAGTEVNGSQIDIVSGSVLTMTKIANASAASETTSLVASPAGIGTSYSSTVILDTAAATARVVFTIKADGTWSLTRIGGTTLTGSWLSSGSASSWDLLFDVTSSSGSTGITRSNQAGTYTQITGDLSYTIEAYSPYSSNITRTGSSTVAIRLKNRSSGAVTTIQTTALNVSATSEYYGGIIP